MSQGSSHAAKKNKFQSAAGGWHNNLRAQRIPKQQMSFMWTVLSHINICFLTDWSNPKSFKICLAFTSPELPNPRKWAALQTFWLHLTFEIPLTLRTITFDIKAHLPRNARSSGDDDNTHVATRVGFLGVIDVDGEVGRGHGHTEAHSFCELVLTVSDLTWAKVYHLHGENTSTETQTSLHRYGLFHSNEHFFEFCLILRCADYHVLHKDNPGIYRWWMLNFSLIFCLR